MTQNPLSHLIESVAAVQRRWAAEPPTYSVVRRGRESMAGWTVEVAEIPAGLVGQAEAVVRRGNREAGFAAYDLWAC